TGGRGVAGRRHVEYVRGDEAVEQVEPLHRRVRRGMRRRHQRTVGAVGGGRRREYARYHEVDDGDRAAAAGGRQHDIVVLGVHDGNTVEFADGEDGERFTTHGAGRRAASEA